MAIGYTTGQPRRAAGISQETCRHWKEALVPPRRGLGQSRCFTEGGLLDVVIVCRQTPDFAIRASAISAIRLSPTSLSSKPYPSRSTNAKAGPRR